LTQVYNWNQYASAYALSRGRQMGTVAVSASLELAMLAVLAERRWDPVAPTVERVEDALRVFPGGLAHGLLAAETLSDVHALIAASARELGDAPAWLTTFLGNWAAATLVDALAGEALVGWMAANALRDADLADADLPRIQEAMDDSNRDVRWRAAHALGSHPTKDTARRLLKAVDDDPDQWVRYGAIRSVIEQAGRGDERLRAWILRNVQRRAMRIRADSLVKSEMEKALQLRQPPPGWASAVEPLLMEMFSASITVADQDHWRRVGQRVTESVRAARAAAT
jgi:HEAT repeat protein